MYSFIPFDFCSVGSIDLFFIHVSIDVLASFCVCFDVSKRSFFFLGNSVTTQNWSHYWLNEGFTGNDGEKRDRAKLMIDILILIFILTSTLIRIQKEGEMKCNEDK